MVVGVDGLRRHKPARAISGRIHSVCVEDRSGENEGRKGGERGRQIGRQIRR